MDLSHQDVLEILELLERTDVEYLELDTGETKLVADKVGTARALQHAHEERPSAVTATAGTAPTPSRPVADTGGAAGDVAEADSVSPRAPAPAEHDLVTVTAPVVGVFYRAPRPGAPPFTDVGEHVSEGTTVALLEVMKMFNSVSAGVGGLVVEILVQDGALVEYGQALMTLRPEPTG